MTALAVRLVHVWQMRATPFFSVLLGDSRGYDEWARRIAGGEWLGGEVFYQAPLYPYMLGVIYAAVGRHPNAARGFDEADLAELRALAAHPRCLAIGETGLDFYREAAPHADQRRAFAAQIALARESGKPLVIHSRAAEQPTLTQLGEEARGVQVVMHCFSMPAHLDECLQRGYIISFAGNVTYPRATELAGAARRVPQERLLVETDAPYLTPQPVRKERNRPAHVVHTAAFLATLRGVALEQLEQALERNAAAVFGWG